MSLEEKLDLLFIHAKWDDLLEIGKLNYDHPLSRIYLILAHQRLGEFEMAIKITEESESLFQNLRDSHPAYYQMYVSRIEVMKTLVTSKGVYYVQSELISFYEGMFEFFEKEGNTIWMIISLTGLCRNYTQVGRFSEAISMIDRAMQLCKTPEIENTILEGFTYHAKSFPYYYMSDYETAVKYNDIAYRILREGLDDIGHRRVLEFQVFNHYLLGEDSKGDHYHEIFKEMVQNKPKLGELDYLIHIDYHKAIKLMRSPRSRYRGKAEELFEKVLSALSTSKTGYFLSKLDVHRFLLEIQLKDLENSSDTELIRDIEFHIEEIRSLAASSGSLLWLTLIDIIKGRILQVKGEFKKAAKILSEIEEQISDSRFKLLQTMVREEKEMMATKFKEIQDIYQSNATIGERIKSMELSEYLTKALSFSEMENGD